MNRPTLIPYTLSCILAAHFVVAVDLHAQVVSEPRDTVVVEADPDDARGVAEGAQARYEIRRARYFPRTLGGSSGPCDETVGRFCTWYGEGNWVPEPEAEEIVSLRTELVAELDSLQQHAPADAWILGQRVWYRVEAGAWEEALDLASACGPPQEPWWCAALTGLTLHGLGRYPEAERAFDVALWEMDVERAWAWRVPTRAVDGEGRRLLESLRSAPTDSVEHVLDRFWALADPLHLVEGNDRKTAHFARWTVATIRDGARTPYGIRWGSDLEELLVRHGWEMGWEREPDLRIAGPDRIVGHKHPEGRDFMPPGTVLEAPGAAIAADFTADRARPRSLYAPPYAPVVLPLAGQVAVFPRGLTFRVVATHQLPPDTTRRAREGLARPWMETDEQDPLPDRAGIHLLDASSGRVLRRAVADTLTGALMIEGGSGTHVLSVEVWSPARRQAGRFRKALVHTPVPEDIPVLSDLLLVEAGGQGPTDAGGDVPADLESAAARALVVPIIDGGERLGIVWEVSGLGFRAETLTFDLSVERTDRNLLQRLGGFLGLTERPRPLALRWQDAGPDEPGAFFRHLELELPDLSGGTYEIRLVLRTQGRDPIDTTRSFEVRPPPPR
ncbi:MAG: hypothetical protein WD995_12250 [Gemmatimonadota bacterium]